MLLRLLLDFREKFRSLYGKTITLIADSAIVASGIFMMCIVTIAMYTTWVAIHDLNENIHQIQKDVQEIRQELR